MYYITPDHYETARKNGITEQNVYKRVCVYNWSIERAITEPQKKVVTNELTQNWSDKAVENRIPKDVFRQRLYIGWEYERAATEPVKKKRRL